MILRFGCPRPSALLIHTHALFTLRASGCHLGHKSDLFHLTARCATQSCIWTRIWMQRHGENAPISTEACFFKESALGPERREAARRGKGVIWPWARRYQIRMKALVFVVIVEQDGWNRIKYDGASHHLGDMTAALSETSEQQQETIADYKSRLRAKDQVNM